VRGFTLIELMVTVAVVAIFSALAGPSFRQLIAQQRVKSAASALVESLWVARSEAIKLNGDVSFKFSNSGADSTVGGWEITNSADGTGTSLHHQDGFPAVASTTSSGGDMLFAFNAFGRLTGSGWVKFNVPAANVYRYVCVSATGRAVVQDSTCP
jgi:type IV fimbrial biogenesis protein FimT